LQLVVAAVPTAKGGAVFDPALAGKTIEVPVTLASGAGATAAARLDIDFWAASVSCATEYCLFDRAEAMLPLASKFQWGFNVTTNNIIDLPQGDRRDYVFASAVGQTSFAGTAVVIDGGRDIESQATLAAGNYTMDRTGLHAAP
jgi:hypothetical protein